MWTLVCARLLLINEMCKVSPETRGPWSLVEDVQEKAGVRAGSSWI